MKSDEKASILLVECHPAGARLISKALSASPENGAMATLHA